MKNLLSILVIVLLSGCYSSVERSKTYGEFPVSRELTGTVIEIDTALFRYPFRIKVHEDRAVILDLHNPHHYYYLFSYPGFRYLASFGKRGEAPGECLSAENIRIVNNEVWALDANKRELKRWDISKPESSVPLLETIPLDAGLLRPLDFVLYDDSTFIIPDYSGENRFCYVSSKGKIMRKSGKIPAENSKDLENAPIVLAQAWRGLFDYQSRQQVLASVTQLGEVLEIYNLKDSTHFFVAGPGGEPEFKTAGSYAIPSGIMGFSDIQITDKYIYTVFHGRTFKEIERSEEMIDGGRYIYVFNLQGEPVCRYILDHYINGIWVDEESKVIIATDVNSDQPVIRFKL